MDKKLAEITVRVTLETKDMLSMLADKRGKNGLSTKPFTSSSGRKAMSDSNSVSYSVPCEDSDELR